MSMNLQQFATIASAIKAAWPSANIMPDEQAKEIMHDGTERAHEHLQVPAINSRAQGEMCRDVTGTYPGLERGLGRCEKGNPVQRDVPGAGSP